MAIPFLCSFAAWIGQYIFPAVSWGQSTLNYNIGGGVTAMFPQQSIAPLMMFVTPNKLSIAIWGASLLISALIVFPCVFLFKKMRWGQLLRTTFLGLFLGVAPPLANYMIYPMAVSGELPNFNYHLMQLFGYYAFVGGFASAGFWLFAIRGNPWFRLARLSN
ncbi:hypothetical protein [Microbulbifer epialgicus]|uniref:Uncharacterized protein n=1 Tax=Microbulbifer epialgicus TaxID=393907 RepID=A0ABV4P5H2_9GAMM